MPRRNEGFGEYCGEPNPNATRMGASCVIRVVPGAGSSHTTHRDLDGRTWTDPEPVTGEPEGGGK